MKLYDFGLTAFIVAAGYLLLIGLLNEEVQKNKMLSKEIMESNIDCD